MDRALPCSSKVSTFPDCPFPLLFTDYNFCNSFQSMEESRRCLEQITDDLRVVLAPEERNTKKKVFICIIFEIYFFPLSVNS